MAPVGEAERRCAVLKRCSHVCDVMQHRGCKGELMVCDIIKNDHKLTIIPWKVWFGMPQILAIPFGKLKILYLCLIVINRYPMQASLVSESMLVFDNEVMYSLKN
jgi:hypothetical protein